MGRSTHRRIRSTLLAVSLAAVSACLGFAPATSGAAPAANEAAGTAGESIYGIHEANSWRRTSGAPSTGQVGALLEGAGAESHRWTIPWNDVERWPPTGGEHEYDFSAFDAMYEADLAHGLRPLIAVVNAPRWAFPPGVPEDARRGIPPAAEHLADWAAFCAEVARRYPEAVGIEIWNEPNLTAFWGRGLAGIVPDPVLYARMLASAEEAIDAVAPGMPVIGGAVSNAPRSLSTGQISGLEFSAAILALGAGDHMDAISVHAYPSAPAALDHTLFRPAVELIRQAQANAGTDLPIWVTEAGVTTTAGSVLQVTEQQQADVLVSFYHWIRSQQDVEAFFLHTMTERDQNEAGPEKGYALVAGDATTGFRAKPAYSALALAASGQSPAQPPAPGPGEVGPGAGALTLAVLGSGKVKRPSRIALSVRCSSDCEVTAEGRLRVGSRKRSKRFEVRADGTTLHGGEAARVVLSFEGKAPRRLRTGRGRVEVSAVASDGAQASTTSRVSF